MKLIIWCLLALFLMIECRSMEYGSGNDPNFSMPIDDEDDYDFNDLDISGSGAGPRNESSTVLPTVVVASSTSTPPRASTKSTSMKVMPTTPKITKARTSAAIIQEVGQSRTEDDETDNEVEDDDDNDDVREDEIEAPKSTVVRTNTYKQTATTSASASDSFDLMEIVWRQPGIVAGLIGGAILGVLFAILLTLFIIYRLRRRADKSFLKANSRGSQDEAGAFWFDDEEAGAIAVSRASAERFPHAQADAYVNPQVMTDTLKGGQKMSMPGGVSAQTQPLLYSSLVTPDAQTAYDEYLANLYNQQLYNGYLQKA